MQVKLLLLDCDILGEATLYNTVSGVLSSTDINLGVLAGLNTISICTLEIDSS
jgi:hypothetical protein